SHEQIWSSSKVARTPPIALEYSDGGTTTPSNTALTKVGESMTRLLSMAAILSVHPAPHVNLVAFFDPPIVIVRNKEEEKAFLASRSHQLNDCKVWWEDNHNVAGPLPDPSNPNYPCSKIHPYWYGAKLDLPEFLYSTLYERVLTPNTSFGLDPTLSGLRILPTCMVRIMTSTWILSLLTRTKNEIYLGLDNLNNNNDIESLGISFPELNDKAFRIILVEHYSWRCLIAFDSMGGMPLQTLILIIPSYIRNEQPPASQTVKDAPKVKKNKRKKHEGIVSKEILIKVLKTVDLTFLVEDGHQQPSIVSGGEGREYSFKKDERLVDTLPEKASSIMVQKQPPQSNNSNCNSKHSLSERASISTLPDVGIANSSL
ncbi:hypothetical protein DVH24_019732, partial [Malus domestica]